jgi:hypothetical protein
MVSGKNIYSLKYICSVCVSCPMFLWVGAQYVYIQVQREGMPQTDAGAPREAPKEVQSGWVQASIAPPFQSWLFRQTRNFLAVMSNTVQYVVSSTYICYTACCLIYIVNVMFDFYFAAANQCQCLSYVVSVPSCRCVSVSEVYTVSYNHQPSLV